MDALSIPGSTLSDIDLMYFAENLPITNFKGVYMRDRLPSQSTRSPNESGIMNLSKSNELGTHWICWYCCGEERLFFDSFGLDVPIELEKYLKTHDEYINNREVIRRNAIIVQHINTSECGRLCLFVLKHLSDGASFDEILQLLKIRCDYNHESRIREKEKE